MNKIAILNTNPETQTKSKELADKLNIQLYTDKVKIIDNAERAVAYFEFVDEKLTLFENCKKPAGGIVVDFTDNATKHRLKYGGGLGQDIAKAVGIKGNFKPRVLDATAGLGGDSFIIASLGCEVDMLERSPVVFELLSDGIGRANEDFEVREIVNKMRVVNNQDSIDFLQKLEDVSKIYDVIYLDPMFPESKKSRLVKKEMRILSEVVGKDLDAKELLELALQKTKNRVVVKRPRKASYIIDVEKLKPSFQIIGKVIRYDVYVK